VFKLSFTDSILDQVWIYFNDKPVLLIAFILTLLIFLLNKKLNIDGESLRYLLSFWLLWFLLFASKNFPDISEGISYIVASGIVIFCIYLSLPQKIKLILNNIFSKKD